MTIKEALVDLIRNEGFDFVTACELAHTVIAEFRASDKSEARYTIGRTAFTLRRNLR